MCTYLTFVRAWYISGWQMCTYLTFVRAWLYFVIISLFKLEIGL
jgi:hypothetical protein